MIKPISFSGVYKFNAPYYKVKLASYYINDNYPKHPNGYPVVNSDKFIFKDVNYKNEVVAVCYDENNENYILTNSHAKEAQKYYSEMMDDFDRYHAYYGADRLTELSCDIAAERYQQQAKSIVDKAKEEGIIEELELEVDSKVFGNAKAPKFTKIS